MILKNKETWKAPFDEVALITVYYDGSFKVVCYSKRGVEKVSSAERDNEHITDYRKYYMKGNGYKLFCSDEYERKKKFEKKLKKWEDSKK